ncbi:MAG TPA: glycosyltransferase family 4 protein [Chitinophagales bacterium]|nr:glycosyltransferase family 4 protein [Chitinophagales bacterium]
MKILQICNKPPFPSADGGAIAMGSMTRAMMKNGYDVTVLSMVSFKHGASENDFPDDVRKKVKLYFAPVDLRLKPHRAFLNLFSSQSYHAERFFSEAFARKLVSILKENRFEMIQLETVFPFVYEKIIRQHSGAKIILRLHNMEHEVWDSTSKAESNLLKKWYFRLLAKRLKIFEEHAHRKADGIITISSADCGKLKALNTTVPIVNIPPGVDLLKYPVAPPANDALPSLFHLGAMDWIPNQIGMSWFLETAWKQLCKMYPRLKFHIAGRKMPEKFFRMQNENLIVADAVAEPVRFMRTKDIMVVPLLSGSGIRVKIIEGMALGKAIIATSIAAAGIDYTDGENILIADTPDEFMKKISWCIENREMLSKIGNKARKLIEEKYSMETVSSLLDEFYRKF